MSLIMSDRVLRLSLGSGERLPCNVCWRVEDGYLRICSWGEGTEQFTLGIWGPGAIVIPDLVGVTPLELRALSSVQVEAQDPTRSEQQLFLEEQCQQASKLLQLTRVRPAEVRLLKLLVWLGQRFGRVSSRGISLSFDDMNLTHRHLAEIAGLTRVTVTKALSRFRQDGLLVNDGHDELLQVDRLQHLDHWRGLSGI